MTMPLDQYDFSIDVYHGTSTLFLKSILDFGLGGINVIEKWKVLDFANFIYSLCEKKISDTQLFERSGFSFKSMCEQKNEGMNFQHGDVYVSGNIDVAVRYTVPKRFGSELLSYALEFLSEMYYRDIDLKEVYDFNPHLFNLMKTIHSPLIVKIPNVHITDLSNDKGELMTDVLTKLNHGLKSKGINFTTQSIKKFAKTCQCRLLKVIPPNRLDFYLPINDKEDISNPYLQKIDLV